MATTTSSTPRTSTASRTIFGVVLFAAWGVGTVLWVASVVDSATHGEVSPVVTAVAAIALLFLLCGMEGLEVAVIDRWGAMYPGRSTHELAAWLAARQLFVALIVTSATLLAKRDALMVPGTSLNLDHGILLDLFDLIWLGLTVLWLAQIFPKHLAATNADRYLHHLRGTLFPIVEGVRRIGVSQPGEWVAVAVERKLSWQPEPGEEPEAVTPERSLGTIWRALIPEEAPPPGGFAARELGEAGQGRETPE
jgi:hypothetical protein